MTQLHPAAEAVFKDTYLLDFLDLPEVHSEADLQHALVANLKQFLLELGRDFSFVGEPKSSPKKIRPRMTTNGHQ